MVLRPKNHRQRMGLELTPLYVAICTIVAVLEFTITGEPAWVSALYSLSVPMFCFVMYLVYGWLGGEDDHDGGRADRGESCDAMPPEPQDDPNWKPRE